MNAARRKEIARAIDKIFKAQEILECVLDEETEAFDNLPESLQGSERGTQMEEYISILEDFIDLLDTSELQEIIDN